MAGKKRNSLTETSNDSLIPAAETPEWALEPTGAVRDQGPELIEEVAA